jgi:hypothetical protein
MTKNKYVCQEKFQYNLNFFEIFPINSFFDDHELVISPFFKAYKRRVIQTPDGVTFLLIPTHKYFSIEFKCTVYEKGWPNGHFHPHEGEKCGHY